MAIIEVSLEIDDEYADHLVGKLEDYVQFLLENGEGREDAVVVQTLAQLVVKLQDELS